MGTETYQLGPPARVGWPGALQLGDRARSRDVVRSLRSARRVKSADVVYDVWSLMVQAVMAWREVGFGADLLGHGRPSSKMAAPPVDAPGLRCCFWRGQFMTSRPTPGRSTTERERAAHRHLDRYGHRLR
jgi:hypothetical protein